MNTPQTGLNRAGFASPEGRRHRHTFLPRGRDLRQRQVRVPPPHRRISHSAGPPPEPPRSNCSNLLGSNRTGKKSVCNQQGVVLLYSPSLPLSLLPFSSSVPLSSTGCSHAARKRAGQKKRKGRERGKRIERKKKGEKERRQEKEDQPHTHTPSPLLPSHGPGGSSSRPAKETLIKTVRERLVAYLQ